MAEAPYPSEQIREIRGKLTLAEFGVIGSLLISIITSSFTFGVLYGQVSENTKFRLSAQEDMTKMRETLSGIATSVDFLVKDAEEQRQINRERNR